jgi:hypothetical protein
MNEKEKKIVKLLKSRAVPLLLINHYWCASGTVAYRKVIVECR